MKCRFSTSLAAYNVPSDLAASKYTVVNAPSSIVPTLLYFESPKCAIDCVWRVAVTKRSGYSESRVRNRQATFSGYLITRSPPGLHSPSAPLVSDPFCTHLLTIKLQSHEIVFEILMIFSLLLAVTLWYPDNKFDVLFQGVHYECDERVLLKNTFVGTFFTLTVEYHIFHLLDLRHCHYQVAKLWLYLGPCCSRQQ